MAKFSSPTAGPLAAGLESDFCRCRLEVLHVFQNFTQGRGQNFSYLEHFGVLGLPNSFSTPVVKIFSCLIPSRRVELGSRQGRTTPGGHRPLRLTSMHALSLRRDEKGPAESSTAPPQPSRGDPHARRASLPALNRHKAARTPPHRRTRNLAPQSPSGGAS